MLRKNGKLFVYTHEQKTTYGTSEDPGVEFTYLITIYDSNYSVDATFSVIKHWEGYFDTDVVTVDRLISQLM